MTIIEGRSASPIGKRDTDLIWIHSSFRLLEHASRHPLRNDVSLEVSTDLENSNVVSLENIEYEKLEGKLL